MLTSPAFKDGGKMPVKCTIDGDCMSPALKWDDAPKGTKSYALLMEDLDVPKEYGGMFIHWMVIDIPADTRELVEGASPAGKLPKGAKEIPNMFTLMGPAAASLVKYGPPWPPTPDHRYKFTIFALKVDKLKLPANAGFPEFQKAVKENTISSSSVTGVYGPAKKPMPQG